MDWNKYFNLLSEWKNLPAYKAEPRVDSFIGYHLKDIVTDLCGSTIIGIIPELPIRLGTVYPLLNTEKAANRSFKVDFYLLDSCGINYFVEFKTDSKSRNSKQDLYLQAAKNIGMEGIVSGIRSISDVSSYKLKYDSLHKKLVELKVVDSFNNYCGKSNKIEIIYVQPCETKGDECIAFKDIAEWIRNKYPNDEFEIQFARTLEEWSTK